MEYEAGLRAARLEDWQFIDQALWGTAFRHRWIPDGLEVKISTLAIWMPDAKETAGLVYTEEQRKKTEAIKQGARLLTKHSVWELGRPFNQPVEPIRKHTEVPYG